MYIIEELTNKGWVPITGDCYYDLIKDHYDRLKQNNTLKDYRLIETKKVESIQTKVLFPTSSN